MHNHLQFSAVGCKIPPVPTIDSNPIGTKTWCPNFKVKTSKQTIKQMRFKNPNTWLATNTLLANNIAKQFILWMINIYIVCIFYHPLMSTHLIKYLQSKRAGSGYNMLTYKCIFNTISDTWLSLLRLMNMPIILCCYLWDKADIV